MKIGIHPDRFANISFSDKWTQFLQDRGVEVEEIDLLAPEALKTVHRYDGIMWRWAHNPQHKQSAKQILYTIENYYHKPVFPNARTSWHYDEKTAQFYLLQALNVPMPKTWLFWNPDQAIHWAKNAAYPIIFKLSNGAASSNVLKLESSEEAVEIIQRMFNGGIYPYTLNEFSTEANSPTPPYWKPEFDYAYFQEFLSGNEFDTRITIIGDRAFGFVRFNRENDFRASGSGRISYSPELIDRRMIEIAFNASRQGKFQSMAYDFLYKEGEPVVCEVSYTYADQNVYDCPGHWRSDLSWVDGHMWPEEAQAIDFINSIENCKSGSGESG